MQHLAPLPWQTQPRPAFACALQTVAPSPPRVPRLLSACLAMGAAICGPPTLDREFRTVDLLTWVDVQATAMVAMQRRGRFIV